MRKTKLKNPRITTEKNKKNGGYIAECARQCGHRFCMKGERNDG